MTARQDEDDSGQVFRIENRLGLHARASAKFVQCVEKFNAEVRVTKDGHMVGGTSIMGLMMLAASKGSSIHVSATGPDAKAALSAIASLIDQKFGESD